MADVEMSNAGSSLVAGGPQPLSGASATRPLLLVVLGEAFSAEKRTLIGERLERELSSWSVEESSFDLRQELSAVASKASIGTDEGPNGERCLEYGSDTLQADILINPRLKTLVTRLRSFLVTPSSYRHLIYSGPALQKTGCWILQDSLFTFAVLADIFRGADVCNAIRAGHVHGALCINLFNESSEWSQLSKLAPQLNIHINPPSPLNLGEGVNGGVGETTQLTNHLLSFLKVSSVKDLLKSTSVVGNIRFSRPTLYIFPAAEGDSALFGISGFNLLVDGGFSRSACFWDFTRHLDRIDAMLVTHLGANNMFGVGSMLARKSAENVHPEIGLVYMNAPPAHKSKETGVAAETSDNGGTNGESSELDSNKTSASRSLLVNISQEATSILDHLHNLSLIPRPCTANIGSPTAATQPTNLYHKVGHGSLDMYILSPTQDGRPLKDFLSRWYKDGFTSRSPPPHSHLPLSHTASVCALLVWRPASPTDTITRVLFTGATPQSSIFDGLDRLKNIGLFQHPVCSERDQKGGGGAAGGGGAGGGTKRGSIKQTPAPAGTGVSGGHQKPLAAKPESSTHNKSTVAAAKSDHHPATANEQSKHPAAAKQQADAAAHSKQQAAAATGGNNKSAGGVGKASEPGKKPLSARKENGKTGSCSTGPLSGRSNHLTAMSNQGQGEEIRPDHVSNESTAVSVEAVQLVETSPLCSSLLPTEQEGEGNVTGTDSSVEHHGASEDRRVDEHEGCPRLVGIDQSAGENTLDPIEHEQQQREEHEQQLQQFEEEQEFEQQQQAQQQRQQEFEQQQQFEQQEFNEQQQYEQVDESILDKPRNAVHEVDERFEAEIAGKYQHGDEAGSYGVGFNEGGLDHHLDLEHKGMMHDRVLSHGGQYDDGLAPQGLPDPVVGQTSNQTFLNEEGIDEVALIRQDSLEDIAATSSPTQQSETPSHPPTVLLSDQLFDITGLHGTVHSVDTGDAASLNPFVGITGEGHSSGEGHIVGGVNEMFSGGGGASHVDSTKEIYLPDPAGLDRDSLERDAMPSEALNKSGDGGDVGTVHEFDPQASWGNPMELPAPNKPGAASGGGPKNGKDQAGGAGGGGGKKEGGGGDEGGKGNESLRSKPPAALGKKARPSTGGVGAESLKDTKQTAADKSMTARSSGAAAPPKNKPAPIASAGAAKAAALKPVVPFYVDLVYVPGHGRAPLVDFDFFRRVRARYYVISAVDSDPATLTALLDAKCTWEGGDGMDVTIIPTYDADVLRYFMAAHADRMNQLRVTVVPAANRCTIQLQDHETSCSAYRLEF